jgi:hypothetical protein
MPKHTVEYDEGFNRGSASSPSVEEVEGVDSQPLRTLSREGMADDVGDFAKAHNLMHKLDVFQKASALIQGDVEIERIPDITEDEVEALRRETERKWSQPKMLYFTILVCSIGAVEQGWAQTSMNGANLYFPKEFGIDSDSPRDNFLVGLINSGIYLSCGVL